MTIPAATSFNTQTFEVTSHVQRVPLQLHAESVEQIDVVSEGVALTYGVDYQIQDLVPGVSATLVRLGSLTDQTITVSIRSFRSQPYDIRPIFDGVQVEAAMDHVALDIEQSVHEARVVKPGDGSVGPDQLDANDSESDLAFRRRIEALAAPNYGAEPLGSLTVGASVEFA